eukprot:scaffold210742_cov26-Tisochrysis_lutea.AAC.1
MNQLWVATIRRRVRSTSCAAAGRAARACSSCSSRRAAGWRPPQAIRLCSAPLGRSGRGRESVDRLSAGPARRPPERRIPA